MLSHRKSSIPALIFLPYLLKERKSSIQSKNNKANLQTRKGRRKKTLVASTTERLRHFPLSITRFVQRTNFITPVCLLLHQVWTATEVDPRKSNACAAAAHKQRTAILMFVCSVVVHSNKQDTSDDDMMMMILLLLLLLPRLRVSTKHTTYCRSKVRFFFSECEKKERGRKKTKKTKRREIKKEKPTGNKIVIIWQSTLIKCTSWLTKKRCWAKKDPEDLWQSRGQTWRKAKERKRNRTPSPACVYSRARTQNKTKTHNNASHAGGHITRQEWPIPVFRNGRIPTAESSGSWWP